MNYIEAVKILVNNPKAIAITFPSASDPRGFRRIELETRMLPVGKYTNLVFPATETKRRQNVVATSPDFLLREDFSIEYKEEEKYTDTDMTRAYRRGFNDAVIQESSKRETEFKKFKKDMAKLFGEER